MSYIKHYHCMKCDDDSCIFQPENRLMKFCQFCGGKLEIISTPVIDPKDVKKELDSQRRYQ